MAAIIELGKRLETSSNYNSAEKTSAYNSLNYDNKFKVHLIINLTEAAGIPS